MLLLIGCVWSIEDKPGSPSDTGETDGTGTGETGPDSAEDTDSGTETDTEPGGCEQDWPDRAVAIDGTCPERPAVDWDLRELWRYERADLMGVTAQVGRYEDGDGDGRVTPADPMGMWVLSDSNEAQGAAYLDAAGTELLFDPTFAADRRAAARAADLDPGRTGIENGVYRYVEDLGIRWTLADEGGAYTAAEMEHYGVPWYTDLESDGVPELVLGGAVLDSQSGVELHALPEAPGGWHLVAADLDSDGVVEVVGEHAGGVGIWTPGGAPPTVCAATMPRGEQQGTTLALANLDGDDDAEILRTDYRLLSLCDADGTLLAEVTTPSAAGAILGVGELDGDPEPEIVLDYNGSEDGVLGAGILVYDHTLAEVWRYTTEGGGWNPFHLADLDGDGRHEVLVREAYALTILDGVGTVLATVEAGYGNNQWKNPPLVVDVDDDGLAEIVTTGSEPAVQVWENAAGGWLVDEAELSTSGIGHHPGILNVDGTVPAETAWWLDANVWQGHPAGPADLADLEVSFEAACAEDCGEDLYVTVYVSNTGAEDVHAPVSLLVERGDGLTLFAARVEPPLAAGSSVPVELRVPPADARHGLVFTVDQGGVVRECDESDNVATWSDTPCP